MRPLSSNDSGSEHSDRTMILTEVAALLRSNDKHAREHAFEKLYKYFQKPIERYLAARIHDQEHVADLSQDTFKRVWKCFLSLETPLPQTANHLQNWLYKIASDVANDDYRRNKLKDFQPLADGEADAQYPELRTEGVEGRIDLISLQEEWSKLTPRVRDCLRLELKGYKQKEAAKELGISEAAMSMNVSRGRAELRGKVYPVTDDLQRAQAEHAQNAIHNLMSGVNGMINVEKIDEYAVKARDWHYRQDMKQRISDLRQEVYAGPLDMCVGKGMYSPGGIWVPYGCYVIKEEDLLSTEELLDILDKLDKKKPIV